MLKNMITSALFAGFAAGLIATVLYISFIVPIVLEAEIYETGDLSYLELDGGVQQDWIRNAKTALATTVTFTGFALLMIAGFAMAERTNAPVSARIGMIWGLAGFIAFHLAPAAGLPPEPPGTIGAEVVSRQIWWTGTVLFTMFGLAAIAFGRNWLVWGLGIAALAAPHLIGAPHPEVVGGNVPPEIASRFTGISLAINAVIWVILGLLAGYFWKQGKET